MGEQEHKLGAKSSAVVLVDVINAFDFPEAEPLVRAAEAVAPQLARFCERARRAHVPIIYVNDNFGRWRSDFKATLEALDVLLQHLKTKTLVLAGFATDLCVLFTAHDAYMRKYELFVPRDLTAANTPELAASALTHMRQALGAVSAPSSALLFE